MRSEIEARLGLKAVDVYGLSEIMGPGVACECECRDGLHGWEDHFLFEVIDPETGAVLPEGEAGELVITTLTKQALPMLRYRTRDITRLTTRALRLRPHACAHPAHHRPQRRHADHPRRQRLPVADRSRADRAPEASRRITSSSSSATAAWTRSASRSRRCPGVDGEMFPTVARDVEHYIKSMIGITTES